MNDIQRIKDLLDSDELYFMLSYTDGGIRERLLTPLKDENRGSKKFEKYVRKAEQYGAVELIIKAYKKANKRFKVRPEFEERILLKRPANLNGYSNAAVEFLEYQRQDLENKLAEQKEENEKLKSLVEKLRERNEVLKDTVKELEWKIKMLERDHQVQVEDIERKYKNFEKLLTLGGSVLVRAAGVDEKTLMGLLGLDDQPAQLPANTQKQETEGTEVSVKINSRDPQKEPAYEIVDQLTDIMQRNVEHNAPEFAMQYVQGLKNIFGYIHQSEAHFNSVLQFINRGFQSENQTVQSTETAQVEEMAETEEN